jgi:hypothetical protein
MKNTKPLNKSQWVRAQPLTIGAKELVERAAGEGIKLSLQQVYTARSSAKQTKREEEADDPKQEFCRLAVRLGTDESQRILDGLSTKH